MKDVVVLGVGMHPFGIWPDSSYADMSLFAGTEALRDAGLTFSQIQAAYVGYIFGQPMTGVRVMKEFGLTGIPIQHIENASASGSAAFREACLAVASGNCNIAMALGFDKMPSGVHMDQGNNYAMKSPEDTILPAAFFAMWATRRMYEYGTRPEHLARIAAKNWNNGAMNPNSQRQTKEAMTPEKVLASPMVAWPLTAMMSCPIGDGAACVIVGHPGLAKKLRPNRPVVRVTATSLQSERYEPGHIFQGPVVGPSKMTRDTAEAAYVEASIEPKDLDLVQVHDAFAIEELLYYELLGLCKEGEAEAAVERGDFEIGGRIPVSTDGGLIARGHPGGPTGLAQIWETVLQLRGEAGARQVDGARIGLCHMMGAGSVCAIHILQRD